MRFRLKFLIAIGWSCLVAGLPTRALGDELDLPRFDILEYQVEGNTRLPDIQIERAVTPFLGEAKTLREVESARLALETTYHDAGYLTVVVSIPEQRVDDGNVILNVVEGQVERLRVKGAEYHLASGIKQQVPELAEGNVPYFPQVQRELDALNRSPDLRATPVLKAGRTAGKVEVQMEVEDDLPLHGSVDYSNRQSANTTAQRRTGTVRYDNLWQLGHSASLTLQTSPQKTDEVRTASATYVMPAGESNALVGYAVISRSKLATLSGSPGLGLLGDTNVYGMRYALSLPGFDNYGHSLSLGFDYKDVKQSVVVAGSAELPTPISYAPLVAAYNGSWLSNGSTTTLETTVTHGVRGLLGNRDEQFAAKRSGASADFFSLRTAVQHTEILARWSLAGKLEMQIASGPLVSNEQFSAGGAESVRGYLEGERVGDSATRLAFEVRTPKFSFSDDDSSPFRFNVLAFVEGVRLKTLQPAAPQPTYQLLRGAGVGLRFAGSHGFSFDLDLARAFDDADLTRAGDMRVHSRLLWDF